MTLGHTSREFAAELQELRERLLLLAARVEEMIDQANKAYQNRDIQLAAETILLDRQVNRDEMEIDALCLSILARRQPMASDLRFLIQALKMVTDLERIGDLAVNVAERVEDLAKDSQAPLHATIPLMADTTRGMVHEAIESFIARDALRARAVMATDDEVDEHYHQLYRDLTQRMKDDNLPVESGARVQRVGKIFERMADHATNLAEQVVFMLEGEDVRHAGKGGNED